MVPAMFAIKRFTLLLSLLFLVLPARADGAPAWNQVDADEGIRTWQRESPAQELPSFRGQAIIDAPLEAIQKVIEDVKRHPEWMQNCTDAKLIEPVSESDAIIYNRTHAPWPVWDRDVVLLTKHHWDVAGKVLTMTFESTAPEKAPLPERTVRMPQLRGYYRIERLGPKQSKVTYEVDADVGGSLPRWLAKRTAKELPFKTLDRLRKRVVGG